MLMFATPYIRQSLSNKATLFCQENYGGIERWHLVWGRSKYVDFSMFSTKRQIFIGILENVASVEADY